MMKFSTNVWAKDGDFNIRSVGSVEEAMAFLANWPVMERGPLYYVAANSIESARVGAITPDDARKALVEFLDDVDALAEDQLAT
jgi:hypothetical protein